MAERMYFVAAAPDAGLVGVLAESDVRRRLAAGSLAPTYVCLPAGATGEVAGQWRPLADVFGTPRPDDPVLLVPAAGEGLPMVMGRRQRSWAGAALMAVGAAVAAGGTTVRVKARDWAWPDQWTYFGNRADTPWAYREALYADLGLAALAFGLGLVLLGIWRTVR